MSTRRQTTARLQLQTLIISAEKNACVQVCVDVSREKRDPKSKREIVRSCGEYTRRYSVGDNQMVTSPSCSVMSFTFGPSSSLGSSSLFPPAAAAKLVVERMLAAGSCDTRGEGGSDTSPLRPKGGVRGAPWRELLRDMECCPARSLVASRSLSRRSAMTFSLAVTSTGLAAPKGLGRLAGLF